MSRKLKAVRLSGREIKATVVKGKIISDRKIHLQSDLNRRAFSRLPAMLQILSFWQSKLPAFRVLVQSIFRQQTKLVRSIWCHENPPRAEFTFGAIFAEIRSMSEKNSRETRNCKEKRVQLVVSAVVTQNLHFPVRK